MALSNYLRRPATDRVAFVCLVGLAMLGQVVFRIEIVGLEWLTAAWLCVGMCIGLAVGEYKKNQNTESKDTFNKELNTK